MRLGNTRLVAVAVVAAGIVAVAAGDAFARSRGSWGSAGSYGSGGSYASSGSYGSGGSYGGSYASYGYASSGSSGSYASYSSSGSSGSASSGSYGGRPGLFARWHARKAAKHASYGSYGSAGSSASSGSYGSYSTYSSSGSSASSGSYGSTIYESYPAEEGTAVPAEAAPTEAAPPEAPSASATEATIFVSLPADAKMFVNDLATTSTGTERHFVSRGLKPGRSYSYKLRVQFDRDGKPVTEDKVVRLTAGENIQLAFGGAETADKTAQTELKLNVPANAKVTLAGAATEQTGETRSYTTDSLAPGQKWNGYTVRVELEQDGKTLVEEKTLDIEGGKTYELAFELAGDSLKVAAN